MATADDLNRQLQAQRDELARLQRLVERNKYTTEVNHLASERARAAAEIPTLQAQIARTQADMAGTQNKYYEASGQYDKLIGGEQRDAYMAITALFKNYGLESLAGKIFDYVKNGYSSDTIGILLQDTPEYKQRFAANEQRKKLGLPVLNPQEYLATERSYRQIMKQAGLPAGFYDSNDDFTKFIAGDLSPTELQSRVELATQATTLADANYKEALKRMGIGQAEVTAYFLDQTKAMPYIQKAAASAALGAEAIRQGFQFDQRYMEELATSGLSRDQAAAGYAKIADEYSSMATLASIYGETWNQREAERATFEGAADIGAKKKRLASQERGAFSGSAGAARGGLAQRGGAR